MKSTKRKNTTATKNSKKRKGFFEQIAESKCQKMSLEDYNKKMEEDADKYLTDAKENKDIQLLATVNKLQKAVKVNIVKIKILEAEIQNLEKKLKEMPAN